MTGKRWVLRGQIHGLNPGEVVEVMAVQEHEALRSRITDEMVERAADEIEVVFERLFDICSTYSTALDSRDRLDDASRVLRAALSETTND